MHHRVYHAHSKNDAGQWNPLRKHLLEVAERAGQFAKPLGQTDTARLAGLLHDLGKYGDLFQDRLHGKEKGLDHWSIGASICLEKFRNPDAALIVQGHHLGLQWWDQLRELIPAELSRHVTDAGRRLTEPDRDVLLNRLAADGIELPLKVDAASPDAKHAAAMLDVRMLYSALTDADYLATEEHFDSSAAALRQPAADLNPSFAIHSLDAHLHELSTLKQLAEHVSLLRRDLLHSCLAAAPCPPGLFTLTAPTGSGKTLSTLAFALRHAEKNDLRRIVVVMPFLSIIDQTVRVYREALARVASHTDFDRYILEHHSLAVDPSEDNLEATRIRGMLAQNWDAPIVITTSVQLLESLFSSSPAACRKLHRLAESVIILDEVQTLPVKLVVPTLATLSHLADRYRTSVIFSTATQPAFAHLHPQVSRLCAMGWQPREIVPPELQLFSRAKRVCVEWLNEGQQLGWEELACRFTGLSQFLCIVNVKRHARALFQQIQPQWHDAAFHLSTSMCPRHREAVLAQVRERLTAGEPCALIATQCVEAGVDLDFPTVFRALGPLDSIAQAAGRCNRNGRLPYGVLHIFRPADEGCPPGVYKQACDLTESLLRGGHVPPMDDPAIFESYFRQLYSLTSLENRPLLNAIASKHFPHVREHYRLIDQDSVNVLVAYNCERFDELSEDVRRDRLSRNWVIRARNYAVSCFRRELAGAMAEPVLLRNATPSPDWYIYLAREHYDHNTGLQIPNELEFLGV